MLSNFPNFTESIYRNFLYQGIRILWDFTLGFIPLSIGLFIIIILIGYFLKKSRKKNKSILSTLFNLVGYIIFFFYILWGFNYSATNLISKINITPKKTTLEELQNHIETTINKTDSLRHLMISSITTEEMFSAEYKQDINIQVQNTLSNYGYPIYGNVKCREVSSSGWLRSLGISGIYFPFSMESYMDGSQTTISKIFTMSHELAHGYGVTHEGEANFIAYQSLINSSIVEMQYVGYFELMLYELIQIRELDFDIYDTLQENLPYWIKEDLKNQRENSKKHTSKFPWLSDKMNDLYLKSQGIDDGTSSYDSVVDMIITYENKKPDSN